MLSIRFGLFLAEIKASLHKKTRVARKYEFLEASNRFGSLKRLFAVIYRSACRPNCHLKSCGL